MMKKAKAGGIVAAIAVTAFLLLSCFPIMRVTDGCECGYKRTWYTMPNSFWDRYRFCVRIERLGNPDHTHHLWDAQWGVWVKLPWQE